MIVTLYGRVTKQDQGDGTFPRLKCMAYIIRTAMLTILIMERPRLNEA